MNRHIVIVGASAAGSRVAEALRGRGCTDPITLVGEEEDVAYDRTALSKSLLTDDSGWELRSIVDPQVFSDVSVLAGVRATSVDRDRRLVVLDGRDALRFSELVIATGSHARRVGDASLPVGVHCLRTAADARAVRAELGNRPRVVVVGGGYVAMEVAAAARARELDVCVLLRGVAPMRRGLGAAVGEAVRRLHEDHGVRILHAEPERFHADGDGHVVALTLTNGQKLAADLVVVGVGADPSTGWLASSGLRGEGGLWCDPTLAVSGFEGVFAAGDVASFVHPVFGERMRTQHWNDALRQADLVASNLLSAPDRQSSYDAVPFAWSSQHGVLIQSVGTPSVADSSQVMSGSLESLRFLMIYGRQGAFIGAVGFDCPRGVMACRRMLAEGLSVNAVEHRLTANLR